MNPRVFVGVAVGILAILLGLIVASGQFVIDDIGGGGQAGSFTVEPVVLGQAGVSILEVTEKGATIEVELVATNPNPKSVILQFVKYELYEGEDRIRVGEIGSRPDAFVTGSNYFTILPDQPTVLSDQFTIRNTGNTPELWESLKGGTASWRIVAEAYFNLSSITGGGENVATYELFP